MKQFFLSLFLLPFLLFADLDHFFSGADDPVMVHHVNVLSGHLNLAFQDATAQGVVPIPLTRTYSSRGAFQSPEILKNLSKGWAIAYGWQLIPHTRLTIFPHSRRHDYMVFTTESNGTEIPYIYSHKEDGVKYRFFLKPKQSIQRASGLLSSRTNPQNNTLCIDQDKGTAILSLPNGGKRIYRGEPSTHFSDYDSTVYLLDEEILPNKQKLHYAYDSQGGLKKIEAKNPKGNKVYASMDFDYASEGKTHPFRLKVSTSDRKELEYQSGRYDQRDCIDTVCANFRPAERIHLNLARKGLGPRLSSIALAGKELFKVNYHVPPDKKQEEKWSKYNNKIPIPIDKVRSLHLPAGPDGQDVEIMKFSYEQFLTRTVDYDGLITKYLHDGEKLSNIFYCNPEDQCYLFQQFYWKDSKLICKAMFDLNKQPIFAKTFSYSGDDVVEEVLWGNVTGRSLSALQITSEGQASGAESYRKTYSYYTGNHNLLATEKEEGGPNYLYIYKPDTDLIEAKLTKNANGQILIREFYFYDEDHLEIRGITDNGISTDPNDLRSVTQRLEKTIERNADSGLPETIIESYWDPLSAQNKQLKKTKFVYIHQKVSEEAVYDAEDAYRYTIYTEYDDFGNIKKQTTPLGGGNSYQYNDLGLIYTPLGSFGYNVMGDMTSTTLPSGEKRKTFYNLLSKAARIIQPDGSQINYFYQTNGALLKIIYPDGTEEHYEYDLFQRITRKIVYAKSQEVLSEEKWEYNAFQLCSYTDPRGLETRMFYDGAGRKIAEEKEGRKTSFVYDALGFLEKTDDGFVASVQKHNLAGLVVEQWEEDAAGRIENRMHFYYDEKNRKKEAVRITSQGKATDRFEYQLDKLVRHIDPEGAVTQFIYDESFLNELGQKVLCKTTLDPLSNALVEIYDAAGRLVCREKKDPQQTLVSKEELSYDRSGNLAKRISYVYLDGILQRKFSVCWKYDSMGRVVEEMESDQKITTFKYDLRGFLYQKTLPSGLQIFSQYDGIGRLLRQYTSDGTLNEQYFYGKGSDPIRILDYVQALSIERTYNLFGEVLTETTSNHSMRWDYDSIGRCQAVYLPDGSSIEYQHTGAHLTAVQRKDASGRPLYGHAYQQFDPNGHVAEEQLIFNLGSIQTAHNLLERPSHQNSAWLEQSISYGPSGLVTAVSNSLFGDKNYEYDPLDQMIREGNKTYHFDSLGNPANSSVNDLNQIISTDRSSFSYDLNGNLRQKSGDQEQIDYKFDPRGRLTEITHPQQKQVRYFYDPLSRLFSKETYHYLDGYWQKQKKIFYLYDRDKEIGTMDEQGNLLELKVLGIGIKGDIGAAVAVEIGSTIYAPLHDFSGHIIALLSQEGQLVETYDIDAFGQEKSPISPISCWRFCSKRSEEGLIFFGLRFYDPSLGRWLTPDPAGFVDGVNLYAYVNNSPINRLDLFGLAGEDPHNLTPLQFNINISSLPESNQLLRCKILEGGAYTDYVVSCGYWHQLNFTPQEIENNSFNLFGHSEIMPSDGRIGLVSYRHGINTKFPEFFAACKSITDQLPGTLFIGRYHGTEGFTTDSLLTTVELQHIETKEVCKTRQFLLNCSELCKINPAISEGSAAMQSLWAHFNHSRGGLIDLRALQGMPYKQKQNLQTQLLLTSIAPAKPISRDFGLEVANYYSEHDLVTGAFGAPDVAMSLVGRCIGSRFGGKLGGSIGSSLGGFIGSYFFGHEDCDIRFVPCTSKWSERSFGIADHAILGGTYRGVVSGSIKQYNKDYGFYDEKNR